MSTRTFTAQIVLILLTGMLLAHSIQANDCVDAHGEHACAMHRARQYSLQSQVSPAHLELMKQYDVSFHHLDIQLERTSTYIQGNVLTKAKVIADQLEAFAFELHPNLAIDSALVNGLKLTVNRNAGEASIALPAALPRDANFEVQIFYKGTPPSDAAAAIGNGLSNAADRRWNQQVTWSLSEPYAAYEWWPCKQVLSDKADSVYVFVTTSADNKVGSNGILTAAVPLPGAKVRYEWKSKYPIAYYLISVAVGQYQEYSFYAKPAGLNDSILVQNYLYNHPEVLPTYQQDIDETAPLLDLYSQQFGLYPFWQEKYGHSMAPLGGGMEHQTMTTQGFFVLELTAHELAHQWFGDYVTCSSWSHIWINEGFASYGEYLALESLRPLNFRQNWLINRHQRVMSVPDGSVYVVDTANVPRIFNGRLTYAKGGAIIHTIRYMLQDDAIFFQVLQTFLQRYAHSTASAEDFRTVLEEVSGKSFTAFFAEWYYGEGYPTYNVTWNYKNGIFYLNNRQEVSASATPFFSTPVEFKVNLAGGRDTLLRISPAALEESYAIPVSGEVLSIDVDPENWIINGEIVIYDSTLTSPISGVLAQQDKEIKVYPNPCQELLNVETITGGGELEVIDLLGRSVIKQSIYPNQTTVDTKVLKTGMYLLKLTDKTGSRQVRFIKE